MRDCGSKRWIRDPASSLPLIVIQDEHGKIFVRAQVRHFSSRALWKGDEEELNLGFQRYRVQDIPPRQRRGHKSVIKNETTGVAIKVFAWRCAQWNAAIESVTMGGGVKEVEANLEVAGNLSKTITCAARLPQGATILPGESQFIEVPHAGSVLSPRKVAVSIVTKSYTDEDGYSTRMEAQLFLRHRKMLTVTLPVDANGNVAGHPIASESGGVLHQIVRVIQNQVNAGRPGFSRSLSINTGATTITASNSTIDDDATTSGGEGESVSAFSAPSTTEEMDGEEDTRTERSPQPLGIDQVGLVLFGWGCVGLGVALGWVLFALGAERY